MFPAHADKARTGKHGIVLTPLRSGTDGFFFASMRRTG
jgi:16S rRNA (cytosine967-C5)-methyltransferase